MPVETYGLTVVTAPVEPPITLGEALDFCEIEHDADNAKLARMIARIRATFERVTERTPITTTYRLNLDDWPEDGVIKLPRSPVQSVTAIEYFTAAGDDQELDEDAYTLDISGNVGRIEPVDAWPETDGRLGGIRVTFVAGYGDTAESVPDDVRGLLAQAVGYVHRYREQADEDLLEQLFLRHWSGAL